MLWFVVAFGDTFDGEIVGLTGAAGENDLLRLAADEDGKDPSGPLDGLGSISTAGMLAGWIAKKLGEEGQHRLQDFFISRRRGRVVEVNHWGFCDFSRNEGIDRPQTYHRGMSE